MEHRCLLVMAIATLIIHDFPLSKDGIGVVKIEG